MKRRVTKKRNLLIAGYLLTQGSVFAQYDTSTIINLNNQGVGYINSNKYDQAIACFEKVLQMNPAYEKASKNLSIAYNNYGLSYYSSNPKKALKLFEMSVFYDPTQTTAKSNLDNTLLSLNINPKSFTDRVKIGDQDRLSANFYGAIVEYKAALQIKDDRDVAIKLGDVYRVLNKNDEAIGEYKIAIQMKDTADIELKLGQAYQAKKDLASAIACYSKASALNPSSSDVIDSLVAAWEDALKDNPTSPANHLGLGRAFQLQGDFGQAEAEYKAALSFSPNHQNTLATQYLNDLGEAKKRYTIDRHVDSGVDYQNRKLYDQAIAEYQKALELDPNNSAILIDLGSAYQAKDDNQNALKYFNKALVADPNNAAAAQGVKLATDAIKEQQLNQTLKTADDEFKAGKYDEALQQYQSLSAKDPQNADLYFNIGAVYQAKGDFNNAVVNYRQAINLCSDPKQLQSYKSALTDALAKSAEPIIKQGSKRLEEKDYAGAETFFEQALTLTPDNASLWFVLASTQYSDQKYDDAKRSFDKALDLDPQGQVNDLYLLGTIAENNSDGQKALQIYKKYLQKAPNGQYIKQANERIAALTKNINNTIKIKSPEELEKIKKANADYSQALQLQQNNQFDQAEKLYQEANSLQPNNSLYIYALGTLYQQKKDNDKALSSYQQAVSMDPTNKDYQSALKNLKDIIASPLVEQAVKKQTDKDYDGAITLYQQALQLLPDSSEIWTDLASAYQANDNFNKALDAYKKGYDLDHKTGVDNLYFIGVLDENNNNGRQALNHYYDYLKAAPKGQYASEAQSRISALTANINNCIKIPTKEQLQASQEASTAFDNAVSLQKAGKYDDAIAAYQKAIAACPTDASYAYSLGTAYQDKGDNTNALIWYSKAHDLDPKNQTYSSLISQLKQQQISGAANDAYNEAVKLQTAQKYDEAIQQYQKAISIAPNDASLYYSLGTCYQAKNDYANALTNYQKALSLAPQEKSYKDVITSLKQAMASPYLDSAYKKQTTKDAKGGYDLAGAVSDYKKALQLDDNATTRLNLGTCYQAMNDNPKAIIEYQKAIELDKNQADAYYYLATVYDAMNRYNQAVINYSKYVKLQPQGPNATSSKQRIEALKKYVSNRRR